MNNTKPGVTILYRTHQHPEGKKIVDILKGLTIDIARRTVTKYREALSILPSPNRKKAG